ncbi:hypothetical protein ALP66_102558, partial [Pseudomonas amygdali pv. photiniae]
MRRGSDWRRPWL